MAQKITKIKKTKKAFTIIEALIFLFIFVVSTLSIYQALNVGMNYIIDNKKRMAAVALANEEIEKYRNIGYENLVPLEPRQVTKNGIVYRVVSNINDYDDPQDGICISLPGGTDAACEDYKQIQVRVLWNLGGAEREVNLNAIIVPPVREEHANKGYLQLYIIGQDGSGLANAPVVIEKVSGGTVFSGRVNSNGILFLPGLDINTTYKISVNSGSAGYFPISTLSASGEFVPDPELEHITISSSTLYVKALRTDVKADLDLAVKDYFGNTVSGTSFSLYGGKEMGKRNDVVDYSFPEGQDPQVISNSDGSESFSGLCFGPYVFQFTDLDDYEFLWLSEKDSREPLNAEKGKIVLNAGDDLEIEAVLAGKNVPSLLVTVVKEEEGVELPLVGAQVRLQFTGEPAYDETLETNMLGQVYFPQSQGEMINDDYQYTVSAEGYEEESDSISINGLTKKKIVLSPS